MGSVHTGANVSLLMERMKFAEWILLRKSFTELGSAIPSGMLDNAATDSDVSSLTIV